MAALVAPVIPATVVMERLARMSTNVTWLTFAMPTRLVSMKKAHTAVCATRATQAMD